MNETTLKSTTQAAPLSPLVALQYAAIAVTHMSGLACSLARLGEELRQVAETNDEGGTICNWADELTVAAHLLGWNCEQLGESLRRAGL